jgi:hypothetical protein
MGKYKRLYPVSIARSQETFKKHYDESHNPLHLMRAFTHAFEYAIPIPQWVQQRLSEVFERYIDSTDKNTSLDTLLGCLKPGRAGRAKTVDEIQQRDVDLMTAIDALHRKGMKVKHACTVAHALYRHTSPPAEGTLYQMYENKWKAILKKIGFYSFGHMTFSEDYLKQIPQNILKKYPDILKEGPWPNESIF